MPAADCRRVTRLARQAGSRYQPSPAWHALVLGDQPHRARRRGARGCGGNLSRPAAEGPPTPPMQRAHPVSMSWARRLQAPPPARTGCSTGPRRPRRRRTRGGARRSRNNFRRTQMLQRRQKKPTLQRSLRGSLTETWRGKRGGRSIASAAGRRRRRFFVDGAQGGGGRGRLPRGQKRGAWLPPWPQRCRPPGRLPSC